MTFPERKNIIDLKIKLLANKGPKIISVYE